MGPLLIGPLLIYSKWTRFDGQRWKPISSPPPSPSRIPFSRSSDYGILLLTFYVFAHYLRNWSSCSRLLLNPWSAPAYFTLLCTLLLSSSSSSIFMRKQFLMLLVMTDSSSSNTSSSSSSSSSLSDVVQSVFSYNGNVMLAALVSFLFVLLFVLLLHIYAKWFFTAHARHRRRRSITPSNLFILPRLTNFHPSIFDSSPTDSRAKGLSPSAVAAIPVFVYSSEKNKNGSECVICLSAFEDSEIGRSLPECSHSFHIECIDMWLSSHSNCPVCRAPVGDDPSWNMEAEEGSGREGESRREILIAVQSCENEIIASAASASSSSTVSFECSLKRMLSRNRSEIKVFPTSGSPESDG